MNQAKLEFAARPQNVALARVAVAAFVADLKFTLSDLEEIKVAVSEAVTNAIVHGYLEQPGGLVQIIMQTHGDMMEIEVIDHGQGIADVARAMEPAYSTDPQRMGLGFTFMNSFMDQLNVQSAKGQGTTIKMSRTAGVLRPVSTLEQ